MMPKLELPVGLTRYNLSRKQKAIEIHNLEEGVTILKSLWGPDKFIVIYENINLEEKVFCGLLSESEIIEKYKVEKQMLKRFKRWL